MIFNKKFAVIIAAITILTILSSTNYLRYNYLQKGNLRIQYEIPKKHSIIINSIIENKLYSYWNMADDSLGDYMSITATITFENKNFISMLITGDFYFAGAAYPKNVCDTLNIDLIDEKQSFFREYIDISKLNEADLISRLETLKFSEDMKESAIANYLQPVFKSFINNIYLKADISDDIKSYVDKSGVYLVFTLPHAIGDYYVFKACDLTL